MDAASQAFPWGEILTGLMQISGLLAGFVIAIVLAIMCIVALAAYAIHAMRVVSHRGVAADTTGVTSTEL